MGRRGPKPINPGELYAFAHLLYWDFKRLVEGSFRSLYDKKKYEELAAEAENVQLNDEQRVNAMQVAEKEIRSGRLKESQREERVREIEEMQLFMTRDLFRRTDAVEGSRKQLKIPGEPEVFEALLRAETPEQVRQICKDAFVSRTIQVASGQYREVELPNWPISAGSVLPHYLSQYATEFIAARKDERFPGSDRPSNRLKQLWFLSRALAGAIYGVKTRTAINLVGSIRPEQVFADFRAAKPARRKRRKK